MTRAWCLLVVLLAGCGSIPIVFPGSDAGGTDAADFDAGFDAGSDDDGGTDGGTQDAGVDGGTRACSITRPCPSPLVCDPAGECVECLTDANCGGALPACDPATKRCVVCRGSVGCTAPEVCSASVPLCVTACSSILNCPGYAGGCQENTCAACNDNDDCGNGRYCESGVHRCVDCLFNSHCGGATPKCDHATGRCAECIVNADCGRRTCFQGTCR